MSGIVHKVTPYSKLGIHVTLIELMSEEFLEPFGIYSCMLFCEEESLAESCLQRSHISIHVSKASV